MRLFKGCNIGWSSDAVVVVDNDGRIYDGCSIGWSSDAIGRIDSDGRVYAGCNIGYSSDAVAVISDNLLFKGCSVGWRSDAIACINRDGKIFDSCNEGWTSDAVACCDEYSYQKDRVYALAAYYIKFVHVSSGSGCFLTTACVKAKGLPDDCDELETLRKYRDTWLTSQSFGKEDIKTYYDIAPQIVEKIDKLDNADEIYECIYNEVIVPCVSYIKNEEYEKAYELYKKTILELKEK